MGARRLALFVVTALSTSSSSGAFAQSGAGDIDIDMTADAPAEEQVVKDPKVAKKWMQAANTLVQKGDQLTKQGKTAEARISYENAATAYAKAIEAGDDVSLHYQIALALDKAGDSVTAMNHLNKVLASGGMKPALLKSAQTKLDEMSMKVGIVTLSITPEGTSVSLAGKPVGEAPLAEPIVLMPGTYVITMTAVGYQPKDLALNIEAGSETERKIVLDPVSIVTRPVDRDEVDPEPARVEANKPSLVPIYIGGGATVGLALVATVTGIAAVGRHGQYTDSRSPSERDDLRSSGKTLALVTDLALVGAVGAAAFTTYWYMVKYKPEARAMAEREAARRSARSPKIGVLPWVQPEAGGLVAVGSF
jgi:hypothetical protein